MALDDKLDDLDRSLDALADSVKDLPDQVEAALGRAAAVGDRSFADALARAMGNLGRSVPVPPPPGQATAGNPFPAGMGGAKAGWPGGPAGPPRSPIGVPTNYNPFPAGMGQPPPPPPPPPSMGAAIGNALGAYAHQAAQGMNARPNNPFSGMAQGAANVAGMVGNVAMVVPGGQVVAGIAKGVEVALKAGGAVADSIENLRKFAETTNEANKRLGAYNPTIAFSQMRLAFGDFRRDFQLARATQDTAAELAHNLDTMRDSFAGFNAFQQNNANRIGSFGAGVNESVGNVLSNLAAGIDKLIGVLDPKTANAVGKALIPESVKAALGPLMNIPAVANAVNKAFAPAANANQPVNLLWHDELARIAAIGPLRKARVVPNP